MLTKVFAVPIVLIVLFAGCAMAQHSSCAASDEAAIRKILAEFTAAWNARSAARYAALFREDADWENAFGGRRKGRKQIEEFISVLLLQFSSAQEVITDTRIWCMRPAVAFVDVYQTISGQKMPSGDTVPPRRIRISQVHEKNGGKWQIRIHRVADLRELPVVTSD